MADDFLGINPDASFYTKADLMSYIRTEAPRVYKSNHLNEESVKIRFYGDAAIAQAYESWERHSGERGRYVWTDTWVRRGGVWQIVAAQDVEVPEPEQAR